MPSSYGDPSPASTLGQTPEQAVCSALASEEVVHGYALLGELGHGGMGIVYRARDEGLGREVAIKTLRRGHLATSDQVERFRREARLTAKLSHPGVPPVHALGTFSDGRPFIAMRLIRGRTLQRELEEVDRVAELQRLLGVFEQICQTVGYAHSVRIIHRDLKPLNVMVGAFGEVQVMDWGLAKELTNPQEREGPENVALRLRVARALDSPDITSAGNAMGTPAYMPPEQARGDWDAVDARADVFALGGILCHVLTGRPPFGGGGRDLAGALGELDRCEADPELVLLCKWLLSTDPADRPATGEEVAEEITAYRTGVVQRAHEKLAATEYGRTVQLAHQEWREHNATGARILLDGTTSQLRGWEWHFVSRLCPGSVLTLKGHTAGVRAAAFSADGSRIVTGSEDATARVWDAKTGAALLTLAEHRADVRAAAFSADGSRIVTASWDGVARVWDARAGDNVLTLKGHADSLFSAAFSGDGSRIVTSSDDGTAKVWDARTGAELLTLRGHAGRVRPASFSADGSRIVTGSSDHTAKVWDARNGTELLTLRGHSGRVRSAAFSVDGSRIVTGSDDATAKVRDAKTGAELLTLKGHTVSVKSAAFSPDGSRVVTGSADNTAKVWDARTGAELLALKGHTSVVWSTSFSADGSRIITGSGDGTAVVWDARPFGRVTLVGSA